MNDIPLIQKADINSINTSIIAIKKQLKQLNEALGLVDVPSIDTSVFVKKSDVVDVVESGNMNPVTSNAVVPVDEVTSGNMHSVTSNAVANAICFSTSEIDTGLKWIDGKTIYKRVISEEISTYSDSSNRRIFTKSVDYIDSLISVSGNWVWLAGVSSSQIGRQLAFGSTLPDTNLTVLWSNNFAKSLGIYDFSFLVYKNNYPVTKIKINLSILYTKN
jgi:hypothetical protein